MTIGAENLEKVREHSRRVFEKQLTSTITDSVSRVLTDYITRPYQQVCDDYIDRNQMETHLFNERIDMAIKTTAEPNMF